MRSFGGKGRGRGIFIIFSSEQGIVKRDDANEWDRFVNIQFKR